MGHFNDYQLSATATAVYREKVPKDQWRLYVALGLAGEAGEVAEKHKKLMRDGYRKELPTEIKKELGDVLWYIAMCAREWGFDLQEIADANLAKLADRRERGALHGSGDNR